MIDEARLLAYEAAKTGALALALLGARLILPEATATALAEDAGRIATVLMPRIEDAGTLADIGQTIVKRVIALGAAVEPRDAAPVFYDLAGFCAAGMPPTISPAKQRAGGLARALLASCEAVFLGAAFLAESRSDFPDRPAGDAARGRISASLDAAGDRIATAAGLDIYGILARVARNAGDKLIAELGDLRPVVRVEAMRSWPSTALAWSLYGDPSRAPELVARNNCGTPLFMPSVVEALSPDVE